MPKTIAVIFRIVENITIKPITAKMASCDDVSNILLASAEAGVSEYQLLGAKADAASKSKELTAPYTSGIIPRRFEENFFLADFTDDGGTVALGGGGGSSIPMTCNSLN